MASGTGLSTQADTHTFSAIEGNMLIKDDGIRRYHLLDEVCTPSNQHAQAV
jgi:hypothetical protein